MARIQCDRDRKLMHLVSADAAGGWAVVKRRRVEQTSRKVYALLLNSEYAATAMAPWQHRWRGARRPAAGASDERHASANDHVP